VNNFRKIVKKKKNGYKIEHMRAPFDLVFWTTVPVSQDLDFYSMLKLKEFVQYKTKMFFHFWTNSEHSHRALTVCGLKFMRVDSGVRVQELFSQCKNIKIL